MDLEVIFVYEVNGKRSFEKPSSGTAYKVAAILKFFKPNGALAAMDLSVLSDGWFSSDDPDAHAKAEAYRLSVKQ